MNELDNFMHSTAHDLGIIINSAGFLQKDKDVVALGILNPDITRWLKQIYQAQRDLVRKQNEFYGANKDKFK